MSGTNRKLKKDTSFRAAIDAPTSPSNAAVYLHDIMKYYIIGDTRFPVLKGIDLTIERGEFVALMGPSGSGKSTLMNILGCLDRPSEGLVMLMGKDLSTLTDDELARLRLDEIGFIFQTFNLINRISVLKNVEMPMIIKEVSRDVRVARARELLSAVGLAHRIEYNPLRLSGGERQRVAIARALANDPPLIIADEPTGNLDLKSSGEVMGILRDLNMEGKTIIMVTHNPEVTVDCNRVIRLRDGKISEA